MNKLVLIIASSMFLFMAFFVGCSPEDGATPKEKQQAGKQSKMAPPDQPEDIDGQVESQSDGKVTVVDVLGDDESEATVRVEINVKPSTKILIREGENQYREGKIEDLKKGTQVKVWYAGMVMDADPMIADGDCIVYEKS